MSTNYSERPVVSTNYDAKRADAFLLTQALSFLLLQDWWKIKLNWYWITQTIYSVRPII